MTNLLANDLFLLMLNLAQLQDMDQIVRVFTEALNSRLAGARLRFSPLDEGLDSQAGAILPVATKHNRYGRIALTGGQDLAPSTRSLVSNAAGMLALILENREQALREQDEKARLDYLAARRTEELTLANRRLSLEVEERAKAQEALRLGEERLRILFDNAADAIFVATMDGGLTQVNRKACASTGYSRDELLGLKITDVDAKVTSPDMLRSVFETLELGAPATLETLHRRKDGWLFPVEAKIVLFQSPEGLRVMGIARDISERKKAEEALRQSEEKFAKAFKASPVWVAITTIEEGRFLEVNDSFTAVSGYTREETIGRTSFDLDFWLDPATDRQQALALFRRGGGFHNLETPMRFKDGQVHTMLWSVDPIEFEGQQCLINVMVDITEQKKAQTEKANLEAQLRQSQKMEAIGTLAGGIAHDFNNILAAVLGFAEMAHEDAKSGRVNPDDLEQVIASAQRAKNLIQQILAFSRKNAPDFKVLDLNRVVRAAEAILERTLPKMIEIQTRLGAGLSPVRADPNQVEQVLLNLAANAADAMPDGGKLLIETQQVELDQDYCRHHLGAQPGPHAVLVFSDTGQGMDATTREHIFEPFFTTKEVGRGTGLGLSSAYGIIESHGGHIHCYSEVGMGTTFKVYLPAFQKAPMVASEEARPADVGGLSGEETILLVDDEESLRKLGVRSLQGMGYTVLTATSGEEALEVFRQRRGALDLVIMDLNMPGMGGHKALKAMLDINPRAKVIIASGYSVNGQVSAALQAGAASYVAKPFHRAKLLAAIRGVLDDQ